MTGLGGRRRRRKWQLIGALGALAIAVSAVYAIRQLMHGGLEPSDTAGLVGLPPGVSGLVVAVVALRKPIEGNDAELARGWAATLAQQVENRESGVWWQLLGDDTRRINLAYNPSLRVRLAVPVSELVTWAMRSKVAARERRPTLSHGMPISEHQRRRAAKSDLYHHSAFRSILRT
ncbi:hypothetical protein ACFWWC_47345 [Streptomyces sp. NPDC058642]|uniref:hypothetical protein n=1 Tax=Streptomyces sp. NPDC058642 TaxID=3346572 RepID=UPI003662B468